MEESNTDIKIIDAHNTYIDEQVVLGKGVIIYPNSYVLGNSKIDENSIIGPNSTIDNSIIGKNVKVTHSIVIESEIKDNSIIGPFSYIRPETIVNENAKVGSFVEVKKSTIGSGSKVPHLSYIGDAYLGSNTNLGAGTITANYDGKQKHKTKIGSNVKVGAGTIIVAPKTVDDNSTTGAGTVLLTNVDKNETIVSNNRNEKL